MKLQSRKQIIDRLERSAKKNRPAYYGCVNYGAQYIFTDGFRAAVLNDNFGYDLAKQQDAGVIERAVKISRSGFKGSDLFDYDDDLKAVELDVERLRMHGAQNKRPYQVGSAFFNPRFLIDAVELICRKALKTTQVLEVYHDGNCLHGLWLFNSDGEAIMVLPVKVNN